MASHDLTDQQKAWFASLSEGIARETGRSLDEWVAIARTCPETGPRARLAWMKVEHGLGQNRASLVFREAYPPETGWSQPDALEAALWKGARARAIFEAARAIAIALEDVVIGQRKGYTAFSRKYQFAAMRPRGGGVLVGLALPVEADTRLAAVAGRAIWSERLTAETMLHDPGEASALTALFAAAWARS